MEWISIDDRLPEEGDKVNFKLDGYSFSGEYGGIQKIGFWWDFSDPLPRKRPVFYSDGGCRVTTFAATHWMPVSEEG